MTTPAQHNTRLNDIMNSIIKAEDTTARFTGLFYGPSGVGKTVLAAAVASQLLPEGKKLIYVDTSEGYLVLKNNHPVLFEKIKYVLPFKSLEHLQTLSLAIKGGHPDFEDVGGIILDEHTKMAKLDLLKTQEERDASALVPEWPDYNVSLQRMVRTLHSLTEVEGLHIFLVGHEKDKKNKKGEVAWTYPSYNPEVGKDIKESLHLVAYCTATPERDMRNPSNLVYQRKAQVMPSTRIDAKTRVSGFSSYLVPYEEVVLRVKDWIESGGQPAEETNTVIDDEVPVEPGTYEELEEVEVEEALTAPVWAN